METESKQPSIDTTTSVTLLSPMQGEVKNITACADPMFAAETMGRGIVVEPKDGTVIAPADATVEFIFPSKHALGLQLKDGSKILIHCGIDTVNLQGEGFEIFVKEGEHVSCGQRLSSMNLELVKEKGYSTQTMMVVSEKADDKEVIITPEKKEILTIC